MKPEHTDAEPPPTRSAEQNAALAKEFCDKQDDIDATQREQGKKRAAPTNNAGRVLNKLKTDDVDEETRPDTQPQAPHRQR